MNNFPVLHEGTAKGCTTHAQHFTSPQQFVDQAHRLFTNTAPADMLKRKGQENEYYPKAQDFNGYMDGYQQRDNAFKRVCNENTRARVHAATLDINQDQTGTQEMQVMDLYHDESGLFLDSNAYFNGDEFNMVSIEAQPQTKPIVYLAVSIASAAQWEDIHYCNRGIAVIRAVHALERKGVSVGVVGYAVSMVTDTKISKSNRKPQRAIMTVLVKAPEQALDESDLINMLTNAGMMRNAGFQNYYYVLGAASSSLGRPQTLTRADMQHASMGDVEIATLPYNNSDKEKFSTVEGAVELLTAAINKQTSITI